MSWTRRRAPLRLVVAACALLGAGGLVASCSSPVTTAAAPRPVGRATSHSTPPSATPPLAAAAARTTAARTTAAPARTTAAAPPSPCATNKARQAVVVQVHRQHVWMCQRHVVVFDSPVTTGAVDRPYDATPTGTFHVQAKDRQRVLTLLSGAQYTVAYWIPFDAPLYGFHDSPWQTMPYGSARFRSAGSHGCVHMPLAAMRFLYRWVDVGAAVRVRT